MNSDTITLATPGGHESTVQALHHAGRRGVLPFLGHFAQMVVAMVVGMAVLHAVLGDSDISDALYALLMAASMTVPMVAWMLFRGHSPRSSAEMAAAMVAPVVAFLPVFWAGLISGNALIGLGHVAMLPSMITVMIYRRGEYGL